MLIIIIKESCAEIFSYLAFETSSLGSVNSFVALARFRALRPDSIYRSESQKGVVSRLVPWVRKRNGVCCT